MLKRLRSAIYAAPDLPRLKAFYAELLGKAPYFDQPFYVGFDVDGYELGLHPDSAPGTQPIAHWRVDSIERTVARAVALGATKHGEPQDVGGGVTMAVVKDPGGNLLGLIHEEAGGHA